MVDDLLTPGPTRTAVAGGASAHDRPASLKQRLLRPDDRTRTRVSQSLLGVPSLLLIQSLLLLRWRMGQLDGAELAAFVGITLSGCLLFVLALVSGLSERISTEPSLSAPQMGYAMVCVGWGYALAGPSRAVLLCLMPVILCFGLFALRPAAARALAIFGVVALGSEMALLVAFVPERHPAADEALHFGFLFMSLAMVQVLSLRLGRIRGRLSAQKAELAEALERISLLAARDGLTGLINRRAADEELRRATGQANRDGRPLAVALVDLDHFKQVNDRFGHTTGDRVLQLFAQVAQRQLRGSDQVARWGGEEFLVLLAGAGRDSAVAALQRLRDAYSRSATECVPPGETLSFSAGLALCTGPEDIEAAIERADKALYEAKQAGRGRTHVEALSVDCMGRASGMGVKAVSAQSASSISAS